MADRKQRPTKLSKVRRSRPVKAKTVPEPLLDVHDIQGNILAGFNKDHQILLALRIHDIRAAKSWLQRIVTEISSTAEVAKFNELFRMQRKRLGCDPKGLISTWANIAFSHHGIEMLTSKEEADGIPDVAFRVGLNKERSADLGDPVAPGESDATKEWVVGGTNLPVDILLIVASDDLGILTSTVNRLSPGINVGQESPAIVWKELGQTRPDLPGHEHFGFKDGVSQPGIRGLVTQHPEVFLTPRRLKPSVPGDVEFSKPGQPLVWPGQFVLGYPSTDGSSGSTGGPVPALAINPPWAKNGSFLVFRRLRQDVSVFHTFLREQASTLSTKPRLSGMTPERLGALFVGRWASGAPISRSPWSDSQALAEQDTANNDFLFTIDTPKPVFRPGYSQSPGGFSQAKEDALGFVCPRAAHIRKMNPRDQDSDLGDRFDTLTRRIIRRGIPYGPPLAEGSPDDHVDRGLHFLSYQASIEGQFEILQKDWANTTKNPTPGGHDFIIGQTADGKRTIDLLVSGQSQTQSLTAPRQWVIPTGGGYFFAPSISAIRDVLGQIDE